MITAHDEIGLVRPKVEEAIRRLTRDGLSTMQAYADFGGRIGKSERWVRKIMGRDTSAEVRLRDALNIMHAYERLCLRIETAADESAGRIKILKGRSDAPAESSRAPGLESMPGSVAPMVREERE